MISSKNKEDNNIYRQKEYFANKSNVSKIMTVNSVELTNNCQLNCVFCPPRNIRTKGYLELNLLEKILSENIEAFNEITCHLAMHGEPTLHPQLYDVIKLFKDYSVIINMPTNCNSLTKEKIKAIFEGGLDQIELCIDAHTQETYQKIRKGGKLELAKNNIREFLKFKNENGYEKPFTTVLIVDTKDNRHEIDQIVKEWSVAGVDRIIKKAYINRANQVEYENDYIHKAFSTDKLTPCEWLWTSVNILHDGSVVPCCQDMLGTIILGNLKDASLFEIMNSDAFVDLRKKHITEKLDGLICNGCLDRRGGETYKDLTILGKCRYLINNKIPKVQQLNSCVTLLYSK